MICASLERIGAKRGKTPFFQYIVDALHTEPLRASVGIEPVTRATILHFLYALTTTTRRQCTTQRNYASCSQTRQTLHTVATASARSCLPQHVLACPHSVSPASTLSCLPQHGLGCPHTVSPASAWSRLPRSRLFQHGLCCLSTFLPAYTISCLPQHVLACLRLVSPASARSRLSPRSCLPPHDLACLPTVSPASTLSRLPPHYPACLHTTSPASARSRLPVPPHCPACQCLRTVSPACAIFCLPPQGLATSRSLRGEVPHCDLLTLRAPRRRCAVGCRSDMLPSRTYRTDGSCECCTPGASGYRHWPPRRRTRRLSILASALVSHSCTSPCGLRKGQAPADSSRPITASLRLAAQEQQILQLQQQFQAPKTTLAELLDQRLFGRRYTTADAWRQFCAATRQPHQSGPAALQGIQELLSTLTLLNVHAIPGHTEQREICSKTS